MDGHILARAERRDDAHPGGRRSVASEEQGCALQRRRYPLSRHEAGSKGAAVRQVEFCDESCGICAGSRTKGFRNASSAACRGTGGWRSAGRWNRLRSMREPMAIHTRRHGCRGRPAAGHTGRDRCPERANTPRQSGSGSLTRRPQPARRRSACRKVFRVVCALSGSICRRRLTHGLQSSRTGTLQDFSSSVCGRSALAPGGCCGGSVAATEKQVLRLSPRPSGHPFAREFRWELRSFVATQR